jgi:hypothetical protein
MCDYSLHSVASRPAKIGDKLVTTEFSNTSTRGFCAIGNCKVVVCLLPGTELAFENEVCRQLTGFQLIFRWRGKENIGHKVAKLRQIELDNPHTHHDALEFPDGQILLLNQLRTGQQATVIQLPSMKAPTQPETHERRTGVSPVIEPTTELSTS